MSIKAMSARLSRRFIIETINDQLKNISQVEHSRHCSVHGFMPNVMAGLVAYCLRDKKPSLKLTEEESVFLRNALVPVS